MTSPQTGVASPDTAFLGYLSLVLSASLQCCLVASMSSSIVQGYERTEPALPIAPGRLCATEQWLRIVTEHGWEAGWHGSPPAAVTRSLAYTEDLMFGERTV